MKHEHSWIQINSSRVIKALDYHAFKYNETIVPRSLYPFFVVGKPTNHVKYGFIDSTRDIRLTLNETIFFKATIKSVFFYYPQNLDRQILVR